MTSQVCYLYNVTVYEVHMKEPLPSVSFKDCMFIPTPKGNYQGISYNVVNVLKKTI